MAGQVAAFDGGATAFIARIRGGSARVYGIGSESKCVRRAGACRQAPSLAQSFLHRFGSPLFGEVRRQPCQPIVSSS
jgi:hypothetical protein